MLSRGQGHADTDAKVPLLPRGPMLNSNNSSLASTPSAAPINLSVGATVSAETKPRTASRRLTSLDVFRGLTVVLMVFVDDAGGVLPSIDHEPWNGLHLADIVMPSFLFIVGVAIAISFHTNPAKATLSRWERTKVAVWRSIKLFVLGILTQSAYNFPFYRLSTMRVGGILQRIAFSYGVVATMEIWLPKFGSEHVRRNEADEPDRLFLFKRMPLHWLVASCFSLLYICLMFGVSVPGYGRGHLDPWNNAAGYIDRQLFGSAHLYCCPTYTRSHWCSSCAPASCPRADAPGWCSTSFDPEGTTSTFNTVLTCWIGAFCGHVVLQYRTARRRLELWLGLGAVCTALGMLVMLTGWMELNKNIWSLSYLFVTAAIATLLLSACYVAVDVVDVAALGRALRPFVWVGQNTLLIYVLFAADLFESIVGWFFWSDPATTNLIYLVEHGIFIHYFGTTAGTVVWTFVKILGFIVLAWYLQRIGWFWKL